MHQLNRGNADWANAGLLPRAARRFARKSNLAAPHAAKQHDGQISKNCPVLTAKIFRFRRRANH